MADFHSHGEELNPTPQPTFAEKADSARTTATESIEMVLRDEIHALKEQLRAQNDSQIFMRQRTQELHLELGWARQVILNLSQGKRR